ncbi:Respiratory nitrate reductase 2 beta chain [Corynebacterium kalinowskii]|uniref:Respiratory nitrate reductase 2 beta chain n=1 Tax=Corynebacterium kalinowskii TaxID=2675216 RepID=A0A6B8VVN2_9CORY|nr:nitrate reductase subunit beta [Corynebacterium kalinowskii]QGU01360.1 Respiratory nitrate reductase 2 beta chain [Corynebacterium kalinowskii]
MKVMAQISMVMNLDKCIGCHTCSVTCKQAWTNRGGTEYVWFNNVETRPGVGYPKQWEDQDKYKGGWVRTSSGKLKPRSGGRLKKLATIFANPDMPDLDDYYEPWSYEYDKLLSTPAGAKHVPTARPVSQLSGKPMDTIKWSSNWDDDLGGSLETMHEDPVLQKMNEQVKTDIENAFMFYLPRICEHCLNPTCVSSCPSGAMYKRVEDGIVLVDQDACRGWRMCVSGCPYKKVYFNHASGKAEKCTLCYPRLEVGEPTICSETCVGRLRYLGVIFYDADRVGEAAATKNEQDLYEAQCDIMLDPHDPAVIEGARREGIPESWIEAAQQSPVWKLIAEYKLALPLHPEYRTLPMVWYIPPLSPVVDAVTASGNDGENHRILYTAISTMRIPLEYMASLFTAGDTAVVEKVLRRLAAMRTHMREIRTGREPSPEIAEAVGLTGEQLKEMYKLLAIAKYDDRYVIPTAHTETPAGIAAMGCAVEDYVGNGADFAAQFHGVAPEEVAAGSGTVPLASWAPGSRPDSMFPRN